MLKIGIICEYNPFHNGHLYHINEIKKKYPDSLIILVLNGYFLQRGEISLISKEDKAKIALKNSIDIVLDLPVLYGTQSADTFTYQAINILNKLSIDKIIFGSESNNIETIKLLANKSLTNNYHEDIKKYLNQGINYPTALAKSLNTDFNYMANDILGISYVKAIIQINPNIEAETILRTNNYLDTNSNDSIISASNIRNKIKNNVAIDRYLPKNSLLKIKKIDENKYFALLKTIIIHSNNLANILDVDEGIEFRLKEMVIKVNSFEEFINLVKTKRYTYNKINRMFIHILLNILKEDAQITNDYFKILGFNQKGQNYLNKLNKNSFRVNKKSKVYTYELKAALFYDILTSSNTYDFELSNKPIIFPFDN